MAPTLLADLGGPGSANPSTVVEVNGIGYFTADDGIHGRELWRTDGSPEGTQMVHDINPGIASSNPVLINFNGTLYFKATVNGGGSNLWKTDGTSEGTLPVVASIPATYSNNAIRNMTVVGNLLFFVTADANNDWELWRSDGTATGTYQVKNIHASGSSFPSNLTNVAGTLYFEANDGVNGHDLWKSDGTLGGTVRVGYSNGAKNQYPGALTNVAGTLYFTTGTGTSRSLWTSDGTTLGTKSIFGRADNLTSLGGSLYFSQASKLYRKTGAAAPQLIADIQPDETGGSMAQFVAAGDKLFFAGWTKTHGAELWVSDGTQGGTRLVRDINPGASGAGIQEITGVAGTVFFTVAASMLGSHGQLWKSDGTAAGTIRIDSWLGSVDAKANRLSNVGGTLYFAALDIQAGNELWRTDGTESGTQRVRDINSQPDADSTPHSFTPAGAITYFVADTLEHGRELWKTDGTTAGTVLVKDISPGQSGSSIRYLTHVDGLLLFLAAADSSMGTLWRSDGTEAGTYPLVGNDWRPSGFYMNPMLTAVGGKLYFSPRDADTGARMWTSDGSVAGTHVLAGPAPLAPSYSYGQEWYPQIAGFGNQVFYVGTRTAADGWYFYELWRYDSSSGEHMKLLDLNKTPTVQQVFTLMSAGHLLYFRTLTGDLWCTDGTTAGTRMLAEDIYLDSGDWVAADGRLFFAGRKATRDYDLWTSDGTPEGTRRVVDVATGAAGFRPDNLTAVGDRVYFTLDVSDGDGSLWVTDGSRLGTFPVPNTQGLRPRSITPVNGRLYFQAASSGGELWTSDGTPQGTYRVSPHKIVHLDLVGDGIENANGLLYFAADDGSHGVEPWVVTPPAVARLFYNNSAFDQSPASTMDDNDAALAVDKLPYIPGNGRATGENVSSYSKGINGLFIDLAPGHGAITAEDFVFRVGTSADPATWTAAPAPLSITVRLGAGIGGHDRVEIVFADGAIKNTWLEVTVRGNDARGGFHANTGLDASSVFYFGNRVGDTFFGNSPASAVTSAADALRIRNSGAASVGSGSRFDINRDGVVSAGDELLARNNPGILLMLDLPALVDASAASHAANPLAVAIASALTSARDATGDADAVDRLSNRERGEVPSAAALFAAAPAAMRQIEAAESLQLVVDVAVSEELDREAEDNFLLDSLLPD